MCILSASLDYFLEEGMATHSSVLAWRIQWTEEPGGLQAIVSQKAGHKWSNLARVLTCYFHQSRSTDGFLELIKLTLAAILLAVVFLLGCLYDPPLNPKHCLSKYVLSQFWLELSQNFDFSSWCVCVGHSVVSNSLWPHEV